MARKNKPAVVRYHDRVARRYDASYQDAYWRWHDSLTWDYIKPYLPSDQTAPVLDLGCGTGKWAIKLLQSGYRVTCVDISGAMVEKARREIEDTPQASRADFLQADICDLSDLPRSSFSFAVAMGEPVCCAGSPPKALKEIRQRLLPGGILIATIDNRHAGLDFYLEAGNPKEMAAFLKTGKTHWLTRDKDEQFDIHTYSPTQAKKLFESAGFEILSVVGKTVLTMRHHRHLLEEPAVAREWMRIEKSLAKDPDASARAPHLQIAARVVDS